LCYNTIIGAPIGVVLDRWEVKLQVG